MDPASLSNLDPKLRETYERVMGANGSAAAAPTPPTPPTDSTTATPAVDPASATAATAPKEEDAPQAPVSLDDINKREAAPVQESSPASDQPQTVTINQPLPAQAESNIITPPPHGHGGLLKVFYVLGGAVFFAIYVLFWMKILNVSLPF